jgi:tol-pal system protein YbgF
MESIMVKTLRVTLFLLLTTPLLVQCVPSQDVNSLDLRIRNLDNQVFLLGKTVNKMGGGSDGGGPGPDNPLDQIQTRQAEIANDIDRLNSEVMQIKGKLEDNSHQSQTSQSESDMVKSDLEKKVDALSQQFVVLTDQVNQNTSALKAGQGSTPPAVTPGQAAEKEPAEVPPHKGKASGKTELKELAANQGKVKPADKKTEEDTDAASPGDPGKAIYDQGLELFRASKFNEAYRTFSDYISKYPKGKMAPNARFWLGDCYYNQQEYELAILEYQKVVENFPNDGKAPAALLKQGLAFEKLKDNETAKIVYNKLMKDYPKSDQVETAKKRLESFK